MLRETFEDGLPPPPTPSPWTASRCNRTLRKLTAFVTKLEKWHRVFLTASQKEMKEEDHQVEIESEPGWLAQDTSKNGQKARKTYTARKKTVPQTPAPKASRKSGPGKSTPHNRSTLRVTKARCSVQWSNAHTHTRNNGDKTGTSSQTRPVGREWTTGTAHLADDYESIVRHGFTVIPAFLVSTSDPNCLSNADSDSEDGLFERGANSLVNMCLSRLSKDMVEQQKQSDMNKDGYDGDRDIIGSQIQELEDYFGDPRTGWPPLRRVLRSCGISLVTRLVRTGALCEETATDLALRWYHRPFLFDFLEAIQDALVDAQFDPVASGTGFHELPSAGEMESSPEMPLGWLKVCEYWKKHLSCQWILRGLRTSEDPVRLMLSGLRYDSLAYFVLVSTVSEPCEDIERYILEAVYRGALTCHQNHGYESLRLTANAALPGIQGLQRVTERTDINERLYNRLTATLCVMLLQSVDTDAGVAPDLITRISKSAQVLVGLGHDLQLSALQQSLVAEIFFAELCRLLIRTCTIPYDLLRSFDSLLCSMKSRQKLSTQMAGTIIAPFGRDLQRVQGLVEQILSINCQDFKALHILLARIVSDGAMEYVATDPTNAAAVPWATMVHEKAQQRLGGLVTQDHTPSNRSLGIRYRWDASMEEWIEKSPATAHNAEDASSEATSGPSLPANDASKLGPFQERCTLPHESTISPSPTVRLIRDHEKGRKRTAPPVDFEVYADGDFEYKRARRRMLPEQRAALRSVGRRATLKCGKQDRENQHTEELSGDELSVLE